MRRELPEVIEKATKAAQFGAARQIARELRRDLPDAAPEASGRLKRSLRVSIEDKRGEPDLKVRGLHHGVATDVETNWLSAQIQDSVDRYPDEIEREIARWINPPQIERELDW